MSNEDPDDRVLVTQGCPSEELIAAMERVVKPQPGVITACIGSHDDIEQRLSLRSVATVDDRAGRSR